VARVLVACLLILGGAGAAHAQQCLHGADETPDQAARRKDALFATRMINNIQANRPDAGRGQYLAHGELASAPFAQQARARGDKAFLRLSLDTADDILPQWKLTLTAAPGGYWFMVRDTSDPCGFAYISTQAGIIFKAEPIR